MTENLVLAEYEGLIKIQEKSGQQISERRSQLVGEIRQGLKTTGDRITDFLIICGEYGKKEFEEKLRQLDQEIKDHQGEFALVAHSHRERHTFGGPEHVYEEFDFHEETDLYLGVIDQRGELILGFNDHSLFGAIPTGQHVLFYDGDLFRKKKPELRQGDISDFGIMSLVYLIFHYQDTIHFAIGDEAVEKWFKSENKLDFSVGHIMLEIFREMMRAIGRTIDVPEITQALEERKAQTIQGIKALLALTTEGKKNLAKLVSQLKDLGISDEEIRATLSELRGQQLADLV